MLNLETTIVETIPHHIIFTCWDCGTHLPYARPAQCPCRVARASAAPLSRFQRQCLFVSLTLLALAALGGVVLAWCGG